MRSKLAATAHAFEKVFRLTSFLWLGSWLAFFLSSSLQLLTHLHATVLSCLIGPVLLLSLKRVLSFLFLSGWDTFCTVF